MTDHIGESAALETLNSWMQEIGSERPITNLDSWVVSEYKDAFLFAPAGGKRANLLFLVRDGRVASFSLSSASLADTYRTLRND